MSKKLAVLVIHGMGSQDPEFATEMINEVKSRISHISLNPDDIAWKSVFWADIVEPRQKEYLQKAKREHDIDAYSIKRICDFISCRCHSLSKNRRRRKRDV